MTLFDPDRHEPLVPRAWDEGVVRAWIARFAEDAEAHWTPHGLWPAHPRDREDDTGDAPYTPLYHGAAGVIWALDALARRGFVRAGRAFGPTLAELLSRNLVELGAAPWGEESLLLGQSGVLLLAWRLSPTAANAERVAASVARNAAHPANELLWGVPGTLHAAAALHEATGEPRFAKLWRDGARSVISALTFMPDIGCDLWTQDLYGKHARYLGAAHGFSGNARALLRGAHLLEASERDALRERLATSLLRLAVRADGRANWPPYVGADASRWLVQWCHGAPGIILDFASLDDARLDALLDEAGALVWQAGPLAKGAGLCHGTAGNGFALLKLAGRTGERGWLDQARSLALHAMAQCDADAARHGQRRYSLWTGDAGVALYAASCIDGHTVMPPLDPEPRDQRPALAAPH